MGDSARIAVQQRVDALLRDMRMLEFLLISVRGRRGKRAWRLECLTDEQRRAIAKATKRVRRAAKRWLPAKLR